MPFRKKVLYYGLLLLLTLLVIEGMARIAYYAAYGPGYGNGNTDNLTPPPLSKLLGKRQSRGGSAIPFTARSGISPITS